MHDSPIMQPSHRTFGGLVGPCMITIQRDHEYDVAHYYGGPYRGYPIPLHDDHTSLELNT